MSTPGLKSKPKSTRQARATQESLPEGRSTKPKENKRVVTPAELMTSLNDVGNGRRIVARYGDVIRFNYHSNEWMVWDSRRFAIDKTNYSFRLATETATSLQTAVDSYDIPITERLKVSRWANASHSVRALKAALEVASNQKTDRGHTVRVGSHELNRNPFQLNLLNGTYDLEADCLRAHDPTDAITFLAPVMYDGKTAAPRWERFLDETFLGDRDLIGYVQKLVGYSVTGLNFEQLLVILNGEGANGKGVFTGTIAELLGDYARHLSVRSLTTAASNDIRSDLASLPGSRFIVASEGNQQDQFDEALVKLLTGEDVIRARFLYQNEFEFRMTGKLWLQTNHLPRVKGSDWAIWRRLVVIPFNQTVRRSPHSLGKGPVCEPKLKAHLVEHEASGILNWILQGCRRWQKEGLGNCDPVDGASGSYRAREDTIREFVSQRCVVREDASAACGDIYRAYRSWCENQGRAPKTQTAFGSALGNAFPSRRDSKGERVRMGIALDA